MLKMKPHCETCRTPTGLTDRAYICSYECTFCESCTTATGAVCPNCKGNLVARPLRTKPPLQALGSQLSRKLFGR